MAYIIRARPDLLLRRHLGLSAPLAVLASSAQFSQSVSLDGLGACRAVCQPKASLPVVYADESLTPRLPSSGPLHLISHFIYTRGQRNETSIIDSGARRIFLPACKKSFFASLALPQ